MPRWSLFALTTPVAALLGWAASVAPFRPWGVFALLTWALAAAHAITALLALAGLRARLTAWRVQSLLALAFLLYLTAHAATSGAYIASLYGGIGRGMAAALFVVWAAFALALLPLALWGIAASGGIRRRRLTAAGGAALLVLFGLNIARERSAAAGEPVPAHGEPLAAAWARARAAEPADPSAGSRASLFTRKPAVCAASPGGGRPTALVTLLNSRKQVATACLQASRPDELRDQVIAHLLANLDRGAAATAIIDEVVRVHTIAPPPSPLLAGLVLRPALDGVCAGAACLAPWQLVAAGAFTAVAPIKEIPDLRFGVDYEPLRRALGAPLAGGAVGLVRIETRATVVDGSGRAHALRRLRAEEEPALDAGSLREAAAGAERFILRAQRPDGRFVYMTDPFTGERSMTGFGIPRQAGTTLALCELGRAAPDVAEAARRSLALLRGFAVRREDFAGLALPPHPPEIVLDIGPTALSLAALLTCRPRVGAQFDAEIGALARFLLRQQRPDGGFYPRFNVNRMSSVPGYEPRYAGGQAVFALVLLEDLVSRAPLAGLPAREAVREAVDRAMGYYAESYWPSFLREFFFFEENWHCLAARAALTVHPRAEYERFCLDFVASRDRLVLDEESGVDAALVGGFGFGNLVPPQNTPSAGHGEALSAAIAVKDARGLDASEDRRTLGRVLRFLMRNQWRAPDTFASAKPEEVLGGFSESLSTAQIRIDYVQHAWAALGHGGSVLFGSGD